MGAVPTGRNRFSGFPVAAGGHEAANAGVERGQGEARQEPLPVDEVVNLDQLQSIVTQQIVHATTTSWAAPMPDPATLMEYERVLPGAADRIMRAFESVTVDASQRDDRIADAAIWVQKTGAGWAYALLSLSLLSAVVFFAVGNAQASIALLGAPIVLTLVTKALSWGRGRKDDT